MTEQERSEYYANRQAYFEKCHDFKEELERWFLNYKPKRTQSHDKLDQRTPEKKTADCSHL